MSYYNRKYNKIKTDNMKFLDCGECAKVLYNNEMIFKEYYSQTTNEYRIKQEIFDLLKSINNPHLMELYDTYCNFNLLELVSNKIGLIPFYIDAYTAKYYPDASVNILYENKDYILDNFRELEKLFEIFTDNMICTDDIKRDNTILGKENITIIDPDLFYRVKESKDYVSTTNKKKLLKLFRSILSNYARKEENCGKLISYIDTEIVNLDITSSTDVTCELSKKLKYINKPIELFKHI